MKKRNVLGFIRDELRIGKLQDNLISDRKKYRWLLVGGMLFILLWQVMFMLNRSAIPNDNPDYMRLGTSGFSHGFAKHFVYFFYHTDHFPLAYRADSTLTAEHQSEAEAMRLIEEEGDQLVNEWGHWSRLGENLRIYCYLPQAWISGSAEKPSIIPFNTILLTVTLMLTWLGFWYYRKPFLGLFIVFLVGSSPFILYEVYRNNNIFALIICNALLLLTMHLPFFKGKFKWKYIWIPLVAGLLVGTFVHIRGEVLPIIASCAVIYWLNREIRWIPRIALTALLLLGYVGAKKGWESHFDQKWAEAKAITAENGGNVYEGGQTAGHMFWHPMFCGLGDYDTKYGYVWHDTVAYSYAVPILKEEYDMDIKWSGQYYIDEYYDDEKWYYKKFDEIPEYEEVMKEKVTSDIKSDPLWYAGILMKRIGGVFHNTSPIHLNLANLRLPIPFWGWMALPLFFLFWRWKDWWNLKLLCFTLPLAATSIIVYGGGNSTYNSIYHLIAFAIYLSWGLEYLLWRRKRKKEAVA